MATCLPPYSFARLSHFCFFSQAASPPLPHFVVCRQHWGSQRRDSEPSRPFAWGWADIAATLGQRLLLERYKSCLLPREAAQLIADAVLQTEVDVSTPVVPGAGRDSSVAQDVGTQRPWLGPRTLGSLETTGLVVLTPSRSSLHKMVYMPQVFMAALLESAGDAFPPNLLSNLRELANPKYVQAEAGWMQFERFLAHFEAVKLTLSFSSSFSRRAALGTSADLTLGSYFGLNPSECALGPEQLRWTFRLRQADVPFFEVQQKFPGDFGKGKPIRHVEDLVTKKHRLSSVQPVSWDSGAMCLNGDQARACDFFTVLDVTDPHIGDCFQVIVLFQARRREGGPSHAKVLEELAKAHAAITLFLPTFGPDAHGRLRWLLVFCSPEAAKAQTSTLEELAKGRDDLPGQRPLPVLVLDGPRLRAHLGPVMADAASILCRSRAGPGPPPPRSAACLLHVSPLRMCCIAGSRVQAGRPHARAAR